MCTFIYNFTHIEKNDMQLTGLIPGQEFNVLT